MCLKLEGELNYSIVDHETVKIVNLSGHISNVTKKKFEDLLSELTQKSNVILNMEDIDIVTSTGLNSLVNVCLDARKRNKRIVLLRLRDNLFKMMEVMNICEYFIFADSIEEGHIKIRHYT